MATSSQNPKPLTASEMGRIGGRNRAKSLTAKERSDIARKAGIQSGFVRRKNRKK